MNEDKSTRYHRSKRRFRLLGAAWQTALLTFVLVSGLARAMAVASATLANIIAPAFSAAVSVSIYTVALLLLHEIGALPIAFYGGFVLEQKYGLSEQTFERWARDQAKSLALTALLGVVVFTLLYSIIRTFPTGWWLVAGIVFALGTAGLARVGPVLLLPLFYRVRRLDRDALTERLLALADRAGTNVMGVYEWSISAKTRTANAALAGLGTTRRILVSDTMLAAYSDEEVEVVLAHELGHHVHGDMWRGLAIQSAIIVAGLAAGAWSLQTAGPALGLSGSADVAGLPLIALAFGVVSVAAVPGVLWFSRSCERNADRFALAMTGNPAAFISAMRRLAAQNMAESHPSRLTQWLFHSHPPIEDRIAAARSFGAAATPSPIAAVSR